MASAPTAIIPARYTCYRAAGPISIDGKLDEPSWQLAPKSTPFVDIVTGQPAWFDTRVALLWDDRCLYFGFWIEESDVWGTLTERDSKIWEENDVEVFIAGRDAYYEFEINALNTVYEVFWIWKDTKFFQLTVNTKNNYINSIQCASHKLPMCHFVVLWMCGKSPDAVPTPLPTAQPRRII